MKKQIILAIDGNYFAHRTLGQLNMGEKINNLETSIELNNFEASLNNSLINLWEAFKPFCDNLIITTDNKSWRKLVEPFKPYYIEPTELIGYKEQRVEKKEDSPINYNNFYTIYNKFLENIKDKVIVFDIEGLEADDILFLLSNKFENIDKTELLVFCNDGDLNQIVNDNVSLFRNIRSNDAPNGEFIISYKKYCDITEEVDKVKVFLGTEDKIITLWKKLLSVDIFTPNLQKSRSLGKGIQIATPYLVRVEKSICGDKKDNIFPILRWKATTGTKNFKVTDTHITKCLKNQELLFCENTCKHLLTQEPKKDSLISLLLDLKTLTKQDVNINDIIRHLKHNLKLNVLSIANIPEEFVNKFNAEWDKKHDIIFGDVFDETVLKIKHQKDNNTEMLSNSIPEELKNLNKF